VSPPSPVAVEKPATPQDAADAKDSTLASVGSVESPKPAGAQQRITTRLLPVLPGLISIEAPVAPRPTGKNASEQRISMLGNTGRW
jgi:hypothetical protein